MDGKLTCTVQTNEQFRAYAELCYRGSKETWSLAGPENQSCTIATTPRPGTHMDDAEWYNFRHLYQTNELGDAILTMPPASSLPIVEQGENAWISKYNSLYAW